jgi:hypothetical protein
LIEDTDEQAVAPDGEVVGHAVTRKEAAEVFPVAGGEVVESFESDEFIFVEVGVEVLGEVAGGIPVAIVEFDIVKDQPACFFPGLW